MIPFLKITTTGYIAAIVLIAAIFLCYMISKRLKDGGCVSIGFTFLLTISVISIFAGSLVGTITTSHTYFYGDVYEAKIISYRSYREKYRDSDDKYRYHNMNVPMYQFTDNKGTLLKIESDEHSSDVPVLGQTETISYNASTGSVVPKTFSTFGLILLGFLFSLVFGFLLTALIFYAFGSRMDTFKEIFAKSLLTALPLCSALFAAGLVYGLYGYYTGTVIMPLWALAFVYLCIAGLLLFLFTTYIKKGRTRS